MKKFQDVVDVMVALQLFGSKKTAEDVIFTRVYNFIADLLGPQELKELLKKYNEHIEKISTQEHKPQPDKPGRALQLISRAPR